MQKGHGFVADEKKPEDYIFGGHKLPDEILQPDGNWTAWLPGKELQKRNNFESMNCVVYGVLNAFEILLKRMGEYETDFNFSERYVGVMAGTTKKGNTPRNVIDTIRKKSGVINEYLLPFDEDVRTWKQYYSPKPMKRKYKKIGRKWRKSHEIGYEFVPRVSMVEALKRSPLGASVNLNYIHSKVKRSPDNHWVTIVNCQQGKWWYIFDHYDNVHKKVIWDYDFSLVMRYHLKEVPYKESWWEKIINFICFN